FLALAETAAPLLSGADQRRWLGKLERDHDNIRAVLDRAVAAPEPAAAARLGFAMWRYWQKRGHLREAGRRLEAIASQPWSRDDAILRARLMEAVGGVAWWSADADRMIAAYGEALELWRAIGDKAEIANALYNHSFRWAISAEPDPDQVGYQMMSEAVNLYREIGDEHGAANAMWGMGNYRYFREIGDNGISNFRAARETFVRTGDVTMHAWANHMLGSALLRLGPMDEAREPLRDALEAFHEAGDVSGIAIVLDDLASLAMGDGDTRRAARLFGAARALSSAGGVGLADFTESSFEESRPTPRTMDPAELERYAAEGRAMSLDDAVAYALDMPVGELPGPHDHGGGTRG
ncbi:MAG TPA: tetratricopeptide repeat protein, partial [Candidatus Limnocylindrales bacterium]